MGAQRPTGGKCYTPLRYLPPTFAFTSDHSYWSVALSYVLFLASLYGRGNKSLGFPDGIGKPLPLQ